MGNRVTSIRLKCAEGQGGPFFVALGKRELSLVVFEDAIAFWRLMNSRGVVWSGVLFFAHQELGAGEALGQSPDVGPKLLTFRGKNRGRFSYPKWKHFDQNLWSPYR